MSGQMEGNRGFVRPMPMTDEAFEAIVKLTQQKPEAADDEANKHAAFAVDDLVEVCDGPFKGMEGPVIEIADEEETLTLALTGETVESRTRACAPAAPPKYGRSMRMECRMRLKLCHLC